MNIGVDVRSLMTKNKTGIGEYAFGLLNAILKTDTTNNYYLFSNASKKTDRNLLAWQQPNTHHIHTNFPNKLLNLALACKLININKLLPEKIDCWYSPNINFLSLNKNIKHILTIHDISFELFPEFYTLKQQLWHKIINPKKQCVRADTIVVPSENTKRDLIEYYQINENKIKVIYPGISPNFDLTDARLKLQKTIVQKKYDLPENFILFLGSIEPRKNLIGLIKAFEKLPKDLSDKFYLIIAGGSGWKNKSIYETAGKSKLRDHIKFLGYIADTDKPALFALSNLFVFPSFYEGFGFPVIEAMKMGTPVITSNRSSMPEITNNATYLINPNNVSNISNAIKSLLKNSKLYEEYLKRGLELASKYTWENSAKEHLAIINS
ncbi:MAG: glycosyltransferase family 1 protein [Candidatus Magasanikbacteria bacterium]